MTALTSKTPKVLTVVVMGDLQIPFQDHPVLDLVLSFIREMKPGTIVLNGDIADLYDLSSFDKDPLSKATVQREKVECAALMRALRDVPQKWWLDGNHEDRLRRYVWKNADKLGQDTSLRFDKFFHLGDYGFQWKPYGESVDLGKLTVTHGSIVRAHSAYSARAHFEHYGSSVLHNHTHRLGVYYRTDRRGTHAGWENGCLCRQDLEYVKSAGFPNWQQGFSVVHVHEGGYFNVQQIPIIGQAFYYGSERYKVSEKGRRG